MSAGIPPARRASRRLLCVSHAFAWANFSISAWVRAHRHQHTAPFQNHWNPARTFQSRRQMLVPADDEAQQGVKRPTVQLKLRPARAPRRPAAIASRVRDRRRRRVASRDVKEGSWCEATFRRNLDEENSLHMHTGGWLHLVRSWRNLDKARQGDTTPDARGKMSVEPRAG